MFNPIMSKIYQSAGAQPQGERDNYSRNTNPNASRGAGPTVDEVD